MTKNSFWTHKRVVVTGGNGFLGSYIVKELKKRGANKILVPRSSEHDLREEKNCNKITRNAHLVFHAAGLVGGIGFNQKYPGSLFYDNIKMGINLIEACRTNMVSKLVNIGTICSYPKNTPVPFTEDLLWEGYPEETNAPYGIAKKALIVQSQAYRQQYGMNIINLLPVNLYGPGDHFDPGKSHVIPALIKNFTDAKLNKVEKVIVWGTGKATREFLYVEDAARGIVDAAEFYNQPGPVNIGSGEEISIYELVEIIKEVTSFNGAVFWDSSKPDGQPRRQLDISKAFNLFGFKARTNFKAGLEKTIKWYLEAYQILPTYNGIKDHKIK